MRRHKGTLRRCIGCMESREKSELLRIVCPKDEAVLDLTGNDPGRGAYLCKSLECLEKAEKKNGFSRVFRKKVSFDSFDEEFRRNVESEM